MIYDLEHQVQQVEKSVLEELQQRILLTNRVDGLANRLSEVEKSVAEEQKQRTLLTSRVDMLDTRLSEVQTVLRQVSALLRMMQANMLNHGLHIKSLLFKDLLPFCQIQVIKPTGEEQE